MKILVRGNLVAQKYVASIRCPNFEDIHTNAIAGEDTDYDLVINGNLEIDSIMFNGAEMFVTGYVMALGKE